ncbi:T-lymphocyte surface antigen Ly-9-like isoform X2 [Rhinoderma darwinii]|uniref:T-lymphocyte surface antigen Ly-9-like isoform X2 n=1 Tax=Rhinoderma darwinii TaxID=43563 RepID=UPI003F66E101
MVLLLLLLIPLQGVISDVNKQTLSAICGGSIMFQLNVSRNTEVNSIFWSHSGIEKCMVAIVKPDQFKVINPRFLNRVNSTQPSFSLKLSNLNEEDNGIYEAIIYTQGATVHQTFKLQVYEKNQSHGVRWTWCNILLIASLGIVAIFNVMTL